MIGEMKTEDIPFERRILALEEESHQRPHKCIGPGSLEKVDDHLVGRFCVETEKNRPED